MYNQNKIPIDVLNNRKTILAHLYDILPISQSKNPIFCAGLESACSSKPPLDDRKKLLKKKKQKKLETEKLHIKMNLTQTLKDHNLNLSQQRYASEKKQSSYLSRRHLSTYGNATDPST